MKIISSETVLTGHWFVREGYVVADETCHRIDQLVNKHLKEVARDPSGWDVLYRDPDDERLWELTYPESHLHGGGPPQLRWLPLEEATSKYGTSFH